MTDEALDRDLLPPEACIMQASLFKNNDTDGGNPSRMSIAIVQTVRCTRGCRTAVGTARAAAT